MEPALHEPVLIGLWQQRWSIVHSKQRFSIIGEALLHLDFNLKKRVLRRIATEETGEAMLERVRTFRALLSETPVDQVEVREYPAVLFRVRNNTWLEAIVRYLVEPKQAGRVKSKLIEKMLEALNAEPARAMFPKGAAR